MPLALAANLAKSRATRSLTDDEASALQRALRTLRSELRAFLGALPVAAQNASGLARLLNIERTTCQRVVSAVTPPYPGIELATQLPGARGLRLLPEAATRAGLGPEPGAMRALVEAIDTYDDTIRSIAGSRSRLVRRIATTIGTERGEHESGATGGAGADAPEMLFEAAAAVTGRHSQLWLAAHIFTPMRDRPHLVAETRAHGLISHRARPDAVPLTFHVFGDDRAEREEPEASRFGPVLADRPDALLPKFSTDPPPIVHSRTPGERVVQAIEPSPDSSHSDPIDLIFGLRGAVSHPATRENRLDEVWALVNFPVRRMLFDVFLHRDLARACIPSLDNHLWRPDFASQTGERWQTRFASAPRLQILPSGLEGAASDAYARYGELLGFLFESAGVDPRQYIGFRCDHPYPLWRTGYLMSFDYTDSD